MGSPFHVLLRGWESRALPFAGMRCPVGTNHRPNGAGHTSPGQRPGYGNALGMGRITYMGSEGTPHRGAHGFIISRPLPGMGIQGVAGMLLLRWSRGKLLHQPFLVGFEGFVLLRLGGDISSSTELRQSAIFCCSVGDGAARATSLRLSLLMASKVPPWDMFTHCSS